jgi:hypothetical protein
MRKTFFILTLLLLVAIPAGARAPEPVSFTLLSLPGDPMPGSNDILCYNHLCIDDVTCPVKVESAKVQMMKNSKQRVQGSFSCKTRRSLVAFEVCTLTLTPFGDHLSTLVFREYKDLTAANQIYAPQPKAWQLLDDELSEFQTTVTFVARTRTKDGQIWRFRPKELTDFLKSKGIIVEIGDFEATRNAWRVEG